MIDDAALQQLMVTTFEYLKMHYQTLSTLMAEIAALRETLREAGGEKFSALFEKHQISQTAKTAAIESATIQIYDEIIRKLKVGEAL